MQFLTSLVLAAFVAYAGGGYLGFIEGNFALLLLLATVVTGIYWLAERFVFLPRREQAAAQLEAHTAARRAELDDEQEQLRKMLERVEAAAAAISPGF